MAFHEMHPTARLLSSVTDTSLNDKISLYGLRLEQEKLSKYVGLFDYYMPAPASQLLIKSGVPIQLGSFRIHSHPISKTIENYFFYEVIGNLLKKEENVTFFSCKVEKIQRLIQRNESKLGFSLINRQLVPKDRIRYDSNSEGQTVFKTQVVHDEAHYWSRSKLDSFLVQNNPEKLFLTLVYPVELTQKLTRSANPTLYEFEIFDGKLIFAPDGKMDQAYEQDPKNDFFFRMNSFKTSAGEIFAVERIGSLGAHHLFLITKNTTYKRSVEVYSNFEIIHPKWLRIFHVTKRAQRVRFEIFSKAILYLLSIKKKDESSAIAKIRQLSTESFLFDEAIFIKVMAEYLEKNGFSFLTEPGWLGKLGKAFWAELCLDYRDEEQSLNDMLTQLSPMKIFMKLKMEDSVEQDSDPLARWFRKKQVNDCDREFYQRESIKEKDPQWISRNFGLLDDQTCFYIPDRQPQSYHLTQILNQKLETVDAREFLRMFVRTGSPSIDLILKKVKIENFSTFLSVINSKGFIRDGSITMINEGLCLDDKPFRERIESQSILKGLSIIQKGDYHKARDYLFGCNKERYIIPNRRVPEGSFAVEASKETVNSLARKTAPALKKKDSKSSFTAFVSKESESENGSEGSIERDFLTLKSEGSLASASKETDDESENSFLDVKGEPEVTKPLVEVLPFDVQVTLPKGQGLNLRGRKSYFFGEFPYGHDRVEYPWNKWDPVFNWSSKFGHFNSVLVQVYKKFGKIPAHADDEDCYDNDPILTVNLKGRALFQIFDHHGREVQSFRMEPRTYFIFPAGFQEDYKHSVTSLTPGRTSLTFRLQKRPVEMRAKGVLVPEEIEQTACDQEVPKEDPEVRNNDCFLTALSESISRDKEQIIQVICRKDPAFRKVIDDDIGFTEMECRQVLEILQIRIRVINEGNEEFWGVSQKKNSHMSKTLELKNCHFTCLNEYGIRPITRKVKERQSVLSLPGLSTVVYTINVERAKRIAGTFRVGQTGVISAKIDGKNIVEPRNDEYPKQEIKTIYGFAGCGKTKPVIDHLLSTEGRALVISPRTFIAKEWKRSLKGKRNIQVRTFETALNILKTMKFPFIIIDEFGLCPPGYLDLAMCYQLDLKAKPSFLILGDPLQALYHNPSDIEDLGEVEFPLAKGVKYLDYTYRSGKWLNKFIDIEVRNGGTNNEITITDKLPKLDEEVDVILVPSFARVEQIEREQKLQRNSKRVMTFGAAQGLTFRRVAIVLTKEGQLCGLNRLLVGLTRSIEAPILVLWGIPLERYNHEVISSFVAEQPLKMEELLEGFRFATKERFGKFEKMSADPMFFSQLDFTPAPIIDEPMMTDVEVIEPKLGVHIPISAPSLPMALHTSQLKDKFERELTILKGKDKFVSDQFFEGENVDNFEAIYMRHKSSDDATFWASVKKRLRFATPAKNKRKFIQSLEDGRQMFEIFKKVLKPSSAPLESFKEICTEELIKKKMNLSEAVLMRNSERSDPDWRPNQIFLFLKNQLCTKLEKRYTEAKAGQTISCFQHMILAKFGPICRATEKKILQMLPDKWYIHSGKNFDSLNEWVLRYNEEGYHVDSDYTAFDASQDHLVLAFEYHLLKYLGWSQDLLEAYVELKTTIGCKLGSLAVMRFTGEFSTFLFNSIVNMLFTVLKYENPERHAIAFAGDDMLALCDLREQHVYRRFLEKLSLKAKVNRSLRPTFCGWYVTMDGILKSPLLVYDRLRIALEKGNVRQVVSNYCLETKFAFELADKLYSHLTEIELFYHQRTVSLLLDFAHLMSPVARACLKGEKVSI